MRIVTASKIDSPPLSYWESVQLPNFKAETIVSAISSHGFLAWRLKLRLVDEQRMKHWLKRDIGQIRLCLDALHENDLRSPLFQVIWNSWNSCPASAVLVCYGQEFLVLESWHKVAGDKETKVDGVGPFSVATPALKVRFGDAATWGLPVGSSITIVKDSYHRKFRKSPVCTPAVSTVARICKEILQVRN